MKELFSLVSSLKSQPIFIHVEIIIEEGHLIFKEDVMFLVHVAVSSRRNDLINVYASEKNHF